MAIYFNLILSIVFCSFIRNLRFDKQTDNQDFFTVKCVSLNISGQFYKYKKFLPILTL